ncbi:alpha-1,4-N-acetyl-D-galactosaminyltransferase [compost metagenome]
MKKILYITNGINGSGGLERVLSIKATVLSEQFGYEVHILVLNGACQKPFYTFAPGIKMHTISVGGNPLQYIQQYRNGIKNIVQEVQPDIVSVCDDGLKGFFVPRILRHSRIPVIYERHASVQIDQQQGLKAKVIQGLMRRLAGGFDAFVVLTQNNLNEWHAHNNLKVIPNPLTFYPEHISDTQAPKMIAVGSHSYNKGYDLLLQVWKRLQDVSPGWELHIYGRIDKEQTYPAMAKELGVANTVYFHEPDPEIMLRYQESSIMVLPSRSEGFGMVLIEAMACGLPCVSFDCPSGPRDIIAHGEDGFLVPPGNVGEMTERLKELMTDDKLRKDMGLLARERVQRFLPKHVIGQWDSLFKQLTK